MGLPQCLCPPKIYYRKQLWIYEHVFYFVWTLGISQCLFPCICSQNLCYFSLPSIPQQHWQQNWRHGIRTTSRRGHLDHESHMCKKSREHPQFNEVTDFLKCSCLKSNTHQFLHYTNFKSGASSQIGQYWVVSNAISYRLQGKQGKRNLQDGSGPSYL